MKTIKSNIDSEELIVLSHKIAKGILSGKISLQEAVVKVMNELNCDERYALSCVYSWIENEPTYNGMVMTSSRKPIKSARFIVEDDYGTVIAEADTYEEAQAVGGTTIIDTQKQLNSNFLKAIVSKVLLNEMTEDEAVEEIASKNNVNTGYAKFIFNDAMEEVDEDDTFIESGVMEIADELEQEFNLNGDLNSWFEDYVGESGKASTIGGELVRAANKIISEYQENGDMIGIGFGKESVNPAARYIVEVADGYKDSNLIQEMIDGVDDVKSYDDWIDEFETSFADYLRDHEEFFHSVNKDAYEDFKEKDDVDSSIDECYIGDKDGNEYWFVRNENDDWELAETIYADEPAFREGEVFDKSSEYASKVDAEEPYGDFEDGEFVYSYESTEEDSNGIAYEWQITDVSLKNPKVIKDDVWIADDFKNEEVFNRNGHEINYRDLY